MGEYKVCNICGKKFVNNIENFYKALSNKDNLQKHCKACELNIKAVYKKKNPQLVKKDNKNYRLKHDIEIKTRKNKKYRNRTPEEIERTRQHYMLPRSKVLNLINTYKKQARKKELIADFNIDQWNSCLEHFNNKCAYCRAEVERLEQEHVIPKSKMGPYTAANILCSCNKCNYKKKSKNLDEWYPIQIFYSEERYKFIKDYLSQFKSLNPL